MVTRRPLVLQLYNISEDIGDEDGVTHQQEEWGEFLHLPGKKFTDFSVLPLHHDVSESTSLCLIVL